MNILLACIPLIGGSLIGFFGPTKEGTEWYDSLDKPVYIPPSYVFAIAWPILYIMLGASFYLYSLYSLSYDFVMALFFINIISNFSFPLFQFRFKSLTGSLISCWLTLLTAIGIVIYLLKTISTLTRSNSKCRLYASIFLLPYIIWLAFACIMITHTYLLNIQNMQLMS